MTDHPAQTPAPSTLTDAEFAQTQGLGFDPQQVLAALADRADRARPLAPATLADAEAAFSARYPTASLFPNPDALDEDGLPDPTGGIYHVSQVQDMLTGIGYDPGRVAAALDAHANPARPGDIYVRDLPDVVTDLTATPAATADVPPAAGEAREPARQDAADLAWIRQYAPDQTQGMDDADALAFAHEVRHEHHHASIEAANQGDLVNGWAAERESAAVEAEDAAAGDDWGW